MLALDFSKLTLYVYHSIILKDDGKEDIAEYYKRKMGKASANSNQ